MQPKWAMSILIVGKLRRAGDVCPQLSMPWGQLGVGCRTQTLGLSLQGVGSDAVSELCEDGWTDGWLDRLMVTCAA